MPLTPAPSPDTAAQPPAADPALAGFRPKPRPAAAAAPPAAADHTDAAPAGTAPDAAAQEPVSPLAVAVSLLPAARPADFSRPVAAALAAASASTAASAAASTAAQSLDPAVVESDGAGDTADVSPAIPTKASVARQATMKNALNMHQAALIGVFGAASSRKALVRLPSGRIVKVSVGDRVDGGKIAAIGEHEVHYVKNGRNIVLAMPKG